MRHSVARYWLALFLVFVVVPSPSAGEWVLSPRDQAAMRAYSHDSFQSKIQDAVAACDYDVKQPIMAYRLSRADGFQLFVSCVRARGIEVLSSSQFRVVADDWNAKNPGSKARGLAMQFSD